MEVQVIEKLKDMNNTEGNFSFNFNAHEETLE
jgi:hypothetical protein